MSDLQIAVISVVGISFFVIWVIYIDPKGVLKAKKIPQVAVGSPTWWRNLLKEFSWTTIILAVLIAIQLNPELRRSWYEYESSGKGYRFFRGTFIPSFIFVTLLIYRIVSLWQDEQIRRMIFRPKIIAFWLTGLIASVLLWSKVFELFFNLLQYWDR